jgi:hypothetical protein
MITYMTKAAVGKSNILLALLNYMTLTQTAWILTRSQPSGPGYTIKKSPKNNSFSRLPAAFFSVPISLRTSHWCGILACRGVSTYVPDRPICDALPDI